MPDTTKRCAEDEKIKWRVLENLDTLDRSGKLEVLDLSEVLSSRARRPAERDTRAALLKYAGTISREDLDIISEAIEEECERVDEEGWPLEEGPHYHPDKIVRSQIPMTHIARRSRSAPREIL